MKDFLTIGQFAVSGSFVLGAGNNREMQPHASLEMIQDLSSKPASQRLTASKNLKWPHDVLFTHHHSNQGQKNQVSTFEGFDQIKVESGPLDFYVCECKVQHSRLTQSDLHLAASGTCLPAEADVSDESSSAAHLLQDINLISQLQWKPKSISDWADTWGELVTMIDISHAPEAHLAGMRGIAASGDRASKIVVSFLGRNVSFSGDTAYVTALNESTGERFEAECEASYLRERGIEGGTEFRCTIIRKGGKTFMEFTPLPPKVLSEEDLESITAEVDLRLKKAT